MMRSIYILAIPAALWAQSTTTTYQTGVNGERVPVSQSSSATGSKTQTIRSADGKPIPSAQSTEKILRNDSSGKVIERIVQRFDANGKPAGNERVLIEETPLPGGGKISKETHSESDMNGHYAPTQRLTTETRVSGQTTTTNVTLDRPTPNNSFQTAEKRTTVTTGPKEKQTSTETVDRPEVSGRFRTVQRTETTTQTAGATSTQNAATYEADVSGRFTLSKQTVATTVKGQNGDVTTTDVYATANLGRSASQSDRLKLQEQVLTEKVLGKDGSVTEVVRVRRPNPSDPASLGRAETVSETVCTGKCLPDAPPPAPAPAPAKAVAAAKPAPAVAKP